MVINNIPVEKRPQQCKSYGRDGDVIASNTFKLGSTQTNGHMPA
jgi:hypothetical protein